MLPPLLLGDEPRLRQILLNLLNNAVKFTSDGYVSLAVRHQGSSAAGERILFTVTDTGIGIPSDKTDRLFKRFSQVDGSIKREFGGTGLGLAISQRLVSLMGGEIGVESEEGSGSTFWFCVTLRKALSAPERRQGAALPALAPAKILVVEDLEVNQEIVESVLRAAGHDVDVVCDGAEALMAVQAKDYDVVLMDVQMPVMDGVSATKAIRALPGAVSRVPIVAMTANVLPQQIGAFKQAGMNDHVSKPFKREELFAALARWTARAEAPAQSSAEDQGIGGETFQGLVSLLGEARAHALLDRLREKLSAAFLDPVSTPEDRRRIEHDAHALVSAAGMLGFADLSRQCSELEQACRRQDSIEAELSRVRLSCARTLEQISGVRTAA
jgi:CheY-like chemotaxis protein/HPt (histidine-containing phosphotransfer) domain-containing protein